MSTKFCWGCFLFSPCAIVIIACLFESTIASIRSRQYRRCTKMLCSSALHSLQNVLSKTMFENVR